MLCSSKCLMVRDDCLLSLYVVSISCIDVLAAFDAASLADVTGFVSLDGASLLWTPPQETLPLFLSVCLILCTVVSLLVCCCAVTVGCWQSLGQQLSQCCEELSSCVWEVGDFRNKWVGAQNFASCKVLGSRCDNPIARHFPESVAHLLFCTYSAVCCRDF